MRAAVSTQRRKALVEAGHFEYRSGTMDVLWSRNCVRPWRSSCLEDEHQAVDDRRPPPGARRLAGRARRRRERQPPAQRRGQRGRIAREGGDEEVLEGVDRQPEDRQRHVPVQLWPCIVMALYSYGTYIVMAPM